MKIRNDHCSGLGFLQESLRHDGAMTDRRAKSGKAPPLPPQARDAIGRQLRENLERIVAEPVPERFLKLLDELERNGAAPRHTSAGRALAEPKPLSRDLD